MILALAMKGQEVLGVKTGKDIIGAIYASGIFSVLYPESDRTLYTDLDGNIVHEH